MSSSHRPLVVKQQKGVSRERRPFLVCDHRTRVQTCPPPVHAQQSGRHPPSPKASCPRPLLPTAPCLTPQGWSRPTKEGSPGPSHRHPHSRSRPSRSSSHARSTADRTDWCHPRTGRCRGKTVHCLPQCPPKTRWTRRRTGRPEDRKGRCPGLGTKPRRRSSCPVPVRSPGSVPAASARAERVL